MMSGKRFFLCRSCSNAELKLRKEGLIDTVKSVSISHIHCSVEFDTLLNQSSQVFARDHVCIVYVSLVKSLLTFHPAPVQVISFVNASMKASQLRLNHSKTQVMWLGTKQQLD